MFRQAKFEEELPDKTAEIPAVIAEEGLRYVSDATPGYQRKLKSSWPGISEQLFTIAMMRLSCTCSFHCLPDLPVNSKRRMPTFNIDMMWMWTSTIVVLLGAQLDSAIDQQTDALSH
jgi:hypothetical protein